MTAPGRDGVDIASRFFAPQSGLPEDPVTGSAHAALAPYWSAGLGKKSLHARQLSARSGELWCDFVSAPNGDRVRIAGQATLYLRGEISVQGIRDCRDGGNP